MVVVVIIITRTQCGCCRMSIVDTRESTRDASAAEIVRQATRPSEEGVC